MSTAHTTGREHSMPKSAWYVVEVHYHSHGESWHDSYGPFRELHTANEFKLSMDLPRQSNDTGESVTVLTRSVFTPSVQVARRLVEGFLT